MKANRGQIERALDIAASDYRLFLLHGPDEASSRELAGRVANSLGADAERIDLPGPALKADPARLTDEAAAISLFGGRRHIRVEPAGDEILDAVDALLEAPSAGNPVVVVAGVLRKESKLLKRALADPAILAFASYTPEGGDADRLAMTMAREHGLRIRPEIARRLAIATGGDRALLARELEKLACYADATPEHPGEIEHDALDALGVVTEDGDLSRLVDAVLDGSAADADVEMSRLAGDGVEGVPVVRALLRRLLLLSQLRAEVAAGNSVEAVMASSGKSLFWKDKAAVSRQVARWTPEAIDTAIARLGAAERAIKSAHGPGLIGVEAEVVLISRHASRMR